MERGLLPRIVIADRLEEADHSFLNEIVGVPVREIIGFCQIPDQTLVLPTQIFNSRIGALRMSSFSQEKNQLLIRHQLKITVIQLRITFIHKQGYYRNRTPQETWTAAAPEKLHWIQQGIQQAASRQPETPLQFRSDDRIIHFSGAELRTPEPPLPPKHSGN